MENDLYKLYQDNIFNLINSYNLKYYWFDIKKEQFFNGTKDYRPYDFIKFLDDPYLKQFNKDKIQLAKDIIKRGTFTPFFFWEIDGKKYIFLGKHRLYSLKLYNQFFPIKRKFLFIEVPLIIEDCDSRQSLYFFEKNNLIPKKYIPKNYLELYKLLCFTGDSLTYYLWENNSEPFSPFNNIDEFNNWIILQKEKKK